MSALRLGSSIIVAIGLGAATSTFFSASCRRSVSETDEQQLESLCGLMSQAAPTGRTASPQAIRELAERWRTLHRPTPRVMALLDPLMRGSPEGLQEFSDATEPVMGSPFYCPVLFRTDPDVERALVGIGNHASATYVQRGRHGTYVSGVRLAAGGSLEIRRALASGVDLGASRTVRIDFPLDSDLGELATTLNGLNGTHFDAALVDVPALRLPPFVLVLPTSSRDVVPFGVRPIIATSMKSGRREFAERVGEGGQRLGFPDKVSLIVLRLETSSVGIQLCETRELGASKVYGCMRSEVVSVAWGEPRGAQALAEALRRTRILHSDAGWALDGSPRLPVQVLTRLGSALDRDRPTAFALLQPVAQPIPTNIDGLVLLAAPVAPALHPE